jgi:predicted ribosome quality control (RQC) complex YloA/Tae2 family protein
MPKEFTSKNGFKILVGKDSKENDYLTRQVAKSTDIFFHVSDYPGSHVILVSEPDKTILMEDLKDAAYLAHYHSKAKAKKSANVDYSTTNNVTKPRGAPCGEVELLKFKTLRSTLNCDSAVRLNLFPT